MGTYKRVVLADFRGAQEHYARGMSLAPGNADLMSDAAAVERSLGQWDTAQKLLRDAAEYRRRRDDELQRAIAGRGQRGRQR